MKILSPLRYSFIILIIICGFLCVIGTGSVDDDGGSLIDVTGVWQCYYTEGKQPGYAGPLLMVINQSAEKLTFSIASHAGGTGSIDGSDIFLTITANGTTYSGTGLSTAYSMDGDWYMSSMSGGTWWAEKATFLATLYKITNGEDIWCYRFVVYAKNAERVYITGDLVEGEYDLYKCGTTQGYQYWWSTDQADCSEGNGYYIITGIPVFPITVTAHVVTAQGETTETVYVNGYETHY
ncbi:MAG: hypothetical protein JXO48_06275 [Deltaproteobacteria bacterium]|nr:hypothetical protein [Deltaproteobacteria bacterium]